jgi:plasmid stability protein
MNSERVQVILDSSQRRALAIRAKQTGRSISDLVREALDLWMASDKETKHIRAIALESAAQLRKRIAIHNFNRPIPDAVEILDQVRNERTDDINHR